MLKKPSTQFLLLICNGRVQDISYGPLLTTLSGTYFEHLFAVNPLVACPRCYQQYSSQLRGTEKGAHDVIISMFYAFCFDSSTVYLVRDEIRSISDSILPQESVRPNAKHKPASLCYSLNSPAQPNLPVTDPSQLLKR